jgi:hypothetical protein
VRREKGRPAHAAGPDRPGSPPRSPNERSRPMLATCPDVHAEAGTADMNGAQWDASYERELQTLLGPPSIGGTWADRIRGIVDAAPPLTAAQREKLRLILRLGPL